MRSENIGARCSAISVILILTAAVARGSFFLSSFFLQFLYRPWFLLSLLPHPLSLAQHQYSGHGGCFIHIMYSWHQPLQETLA